MGESKLKHRLAALLSADVVGYSRLMAEDELSTVRTLAICRDKVQSLIHASGGRVALNQMEAATGIADRIHRAQPDFTLDKYTQTQPYKNPDTLEQLLATLRKAGLQ